jgi:hypothetical protein
MKNHVIPNSNKIIFQLIYSALFVLIGANHLYAKSHLSNTFTVNKTSLFIQNTEIDKDYVFFIDSLWKIDQFVRKSHKYRKARKYIIAFKKDSSLLDTKEYMMSKKLISEWEEIDSLNSIALIKKIKSSGFPTKEKIGEKHFNHFFEMLVHFGYHDLQNEFLSILDEALTDSIIEPSMYAYIKDSYLFRYLDKQEYYQYQCFMFRELQNEQKEQVINNRKAIGISNNEFKDSGFIATWE